MHPHIDGQRFPCEFEVGFVPFDEIRRSMDVDVGRARENVLVRTARVHNPLLDCQPLYFP